MLRMLAGSAENASVAWLVDRFFTCEEVLRRKDGTTLKGVVKRKQFPRHPILLQRSRLNWSYTPQESAHLRFAEMSSICSGPRICTFYNP